MQLGGPHSFGHFGAGGSVGWADEDRWEETLAHVREEMGRDRQIAWDWQSPDMPAELKAEIPIKPPVTQTTIEQGHQEAAA